MWVWVALNARTKLIPAFALGKRTLKCADRLVRTLHKTLYTTAPTPTFSTDGLPLYFYSHTAHFGAWQPVTGTIARSPR